MAKIRISIGELPLGAEDIEPSTDGSAPYSISTPIGSVSQVIPLIAWCDTAGYNKVTDLVIPAVDTRVRFFDGTAWGGWGTGVTVPAPITNNGVAFALQTRGLAGDTTPLNVKLVIEQGGIEAATETTLPFVVDGATSDPDTATLINIASVFSGSEWGVQVHYGIKDSAVLGYGGALVELPTATEVTTGAEVATITLISTLTAATDAITNADAGAIAVILTAPTLSSMTAGDGQFTVTVGSVTGATSYDLRYKLTSGSTWTTVTGVGSGTETVTGLTNGSSYDVQARANNADGSGAWSATSTVMPEAASSSMTGRYYALNTLRDSGWTGDWKLDTAHSGNFGHARVESSSNQTIYYRLVKLSGTTTVTAIKDWTSIGTVTFGVGDFALSVTSQSITDPGIGENEFFAIQFRIGSSTTTGYFSLAVGVNPGAQSSMTVYVDGYCGEEDAEGDLIDVCDIFWGHVAGSYSTTTGINFSG